MLNDRAVVIFGFIMLRDLVINEWLINFLHRIQFGEWFHAEPVWKNNGRGAFMGAEANLYCFVGLIRDAIY